MTATIELDKIERVLIQGDLSKLSENERICYYKAVCESVGLNPLTKPFEYIFLNSKLVLYAAKACTDQLRSVHKISIEITSREKIGDVYIVTAMAKKPDGRVDGSTGAVAVGKASGDALANLYMKAETKAKRRVTLSICGLGLLDETEVETIPGAKRGEPTQSPQVEFKNAPALTGPIETSKSIQEEFTHPGDVLIEYGKSTTGKRFHEFTVQEIKNYVNAISSSGKPISDAAQKFMRDAENYIQFEENLIAQDLENN